MSLKFILFSSNEHILVKELSIYSSAPAHTRNTTGFKAMKSSLGTLKCVLCYVLCTTNSIDNGANVQIKPPNGCFSNFVYENRLSELQCCEGACFHILGQRNNRSVSMAGILVNIIKEEFHDMKVQTRTPKWTIFQALEKQKSIFIMK